MDNEACPTGKCRRLKPLQRLVIYEYRTLFNSHFRTDPKPGVFSRGLFQCASEKIIPRISRTHPVTRGDACICRRLCIPSEFNSIHSPPKAVRPLQEYSFQSITSRFESRDFSRIFHLLVLPNTQLLTRTFVGLHLQTPFRAPLVQSIHFPFPIDPADPIAFYKLKFLAQ